MLHNFGGQVFIKGGVFCLVRIHLSHLLLEHVTATLLQGKPKPAIVEKVTWAGMEVSLDNGQQRLAEPDAVNKPLNQLVWMLPVPRLEAFQT